VKLNIMVFVFFLFIFICWFSVHLSISSSQSCEPE
jgi:hypothetical protein